MKRALTLALVIGLSVGYRGAHAATPVVEVGENLAVNTASMVELILHTTKWVLELLPLEDFVLADGTFDEDLNALHAMVEEGEDISLGLSAVNGRLLPLLDPATAPATTVEYHERMTEIDQALFEVHGYSMRAQTLTTSLLRLVQRLLPLLGQVLGAVGNVQTTQAVNQHLSMVTQSLESQRLQTAAFNQARSFGLLVEPLQRQFIRNWNELTSSDMPRVRRW